jgi:hypothetical protein
MGTRANAVRRIQNASYQPATAAALLRMLCVQDKTIMGQRPALIAWLTENPPNRELRISLRRNGYGLLMDQIYGAPRLRPSA